MISYLCILLSCFTITVFAQGNDALQTILVDSVTQNTAIISWTEDPNSLLYETYYTGPDGVEEKLTTQNPTATLLGLTPASQYDIRVTSTNNGVLVIGSTTITTLASGTFFFEYGNSADRLLQDALTSIDITNSFKIAGESSTKRVEVYRTGKVSIRTIDDTQTDIEILDSRITTNNVGAIYYRTSDQGTDQITYAEAERAIRNAAPEFLGHSLITIVVVSWVDVPKFRTNPAVRNTFQVLIGITDSERTYVIFNYNKINWRGRSAGIKVNGTSFVNLNLDDLVTRSNYGVLGSWLFEVSDTIREIGKVQCGPSLPNPCYNGGTCHGDKCVCDEGFSGNFCHLDECNNRCLNGASCEQGNCTCLAGFDGDMCQDKLTSVECGSTSMTVHVDARLVTGNASGVHFRNRSCNGVIDAITDEITLTTDYNECGTTLEEDNTTITFSNVITYTKPGLEDGSVITREYHMQVRVECCLEKEEILSGSFKPQLGEVAFSDKGSGDFHLILERFRTDEFNERESETTSVVWKGDDLYFGVYLESVSGVGMFIDSCWATTTQDADAGPRYSLIYSGCPDEETVAINRLLGLDREGFSFRAFAFVGDYTEVYIHCSVKVCSAAKAQSFRDAGCSSETPPPDRKRRSSSFLSTQTISNGPIHIRRPTSDMATNDLSYNPPAMLLLGMIATLVAMAILLGVVKLVRISSDNNYYQRVPIAVSCEGN